MIFYLPIVCKFSISHFNFSLFCTFPLISPSFFFFSGILFLSALRQCTSRHVDCALLSTLKIVPDFSISTYLPIFSLPFPIVFYRSVNSFSLSVQMSIRPHGLANQAKQQNLANSLKRSYWEGWVKPNSTAGNTTSTVFAASKRVDDELCVCRQALCRATQPPRLLQQQRRWGNRGRTTSDWDIPATATARESDLLMEDRPIQKRRRLEDRRFEI